MTSLCNSSHSSQSPKALPYWTFRHRSRDTTNTSALLNKPHPTIPPPEYWDNLSPEFEIPFSKHALRELDRRNDRRDRQDPTRIAPIPVLPLRRSRRLASTPQRARKDDYAILPADQFIEQCSSQHLKLLKKSALHGGPDLRNLRGHLTLWELIPNRSMTCPDSSSSPGHQKRGSKLPAKDFQTTGPYDRAFQQHLVEHGIYTDAYRYVDGTAPKKPDNLQAIRRALRQRRPSLSLIQFPDDKYEEFQEAAQQVSNESAVLTEVISIIEGTVGDKRCVARHVKFNNFGHLTNGTVVAASPDISYGARPEQVNLRVRQDLYHLIVPTTQKDLPVAPNFFFEVKGPNGTAMVLKLQCLYDTVLGERGQDALLAYGKTEPSYDNKAHTIGCTYNDGLLKIYAAHLIPPARPGANPEAIITLVTAPSLVSDSRSFREGVAAYRNARDWAKKQREAAIKKANMILAKQGLKASDRSRDRSPGDDGPAKKRRKLKNT